MSDSLKIFQQLYSVIEDRKQADPKASYTAELFNEGLNKIAKKFGEESAEVIIASLNEGRDRAISETADLLYHLFVLLVAQNISLEDICNELAGRHNQN